MVGQEAEVEEWSAIRGFRALGKGGGRSLTFGLILSVTPYSSPVVGMGEGTSLAAGALHPDSDPFVMDSWYLLDGLPAGIGPLAKGPVNHVAPIFPPE